ncbi:unnamed protein product [Auanema sp. JU1783]|nr:unnamed protein product [Auanema sp. JU1783]
MSVPINKPSGKRGNEFSDDSLEWENHFVLRVPEDVASKIDGMLDDQQNAVKEDLAIQFTTPDMRHATVRVGQHLLNAKVHDLPCISEVMKTIDRKNFFKVTDLSQIMVCSTGTSQIENTTNALTTETTTEARSNTKKEVKQWQYPHGLTPPMKSVRRRRFRKTKKKKYMDAPEVEKELKKLLRADLDAESIRWEIVPTEDKKKEKPSAEGGAAVDDQALFGDKLTSSEDDDAEPEQVEEKEDQI